MVLANPSYRTAPDRQAALSAATLVLCLAPCPRGQERHMSHTRTATPSGLPRLTKASLEADRIAEAFTGLPKGVKHPNQLLRTFKDVARWYGIPPRQVELLDLLFRYTYPQDWAPGARPIVWLSNAFMQDALGLCETQVRATVTGLIEHRLIARKDSANGKRYGRRDASGRIVEAYGFDLSPLAVRYQEFRAAVEAHQAERAMMRDLHQRATRARKGLRQILDTAREQGLDRPGSGCDLKELEEAVQAITTDLKTAQRVEDLQAGVAALERHWQRARTWLEGQLNSGETAATDGETAGQGAVYRGHSIHTDSGPTKTDTVSAEQACNPQAAEQPVCDSPQPSGPDARADRSTAEIVTTAELLRLAPRLRRYLTVSGPEPQWNDLIDAARALGLREMDLCQKLWGEACQVMGRREAAIAVAFVSARPDAFFTRGPGAFFYGMVAKAKAGKLNLVGTLKGLRKAAGAAPSAKRAATGRGGVFAERLGLHGPSW